MRRTAIVVVALLLVLCCLAAVFGGLAYVYYGTAVEARPMVFINSPSHGQQVEVGDVISVQAVARDETKVTRVELWVDGVLLTSQESSLPRGVSPFPLLATWQPLAPGNHVLIVRAFNVQNAHASSAVTVAALGLPDTDGDGVADEDDSCPDEAGPARSAGCPDSDGDGIPDAGDACPDQVGVPEAEGCPSVTDADRDGDGVADAADACPDEPGPPQHEGCPRPADLDGDGVDDELDACPGEPGVVGLNGCPDQDGDGISDRDDDCPTQPGPPEHGGCPDSDGDGVRDPDDLRPHEPGLPEDFGAPDTGAQDSDGDGIPDDIDRCDDEVGLPEHDGCAPPEFGEEEPPGGGFTLVSVAEDFLLPPLPPAMTLVEFEALEFEVFDDYDDVYCYAALAGGGMERYGPFDPLGERRWDIAEYVGGENSRRVAVPMDEDLQVQAECVGYATDYGLDWTAEAIYDLGSFQTSHNRGEWTGEDIVVESEPGPGGHYFRVTYRLCAGSCEAAALPAPYIHTMYELMGQPRIAWSWGGDDAAIRGFNLYVNENLWRSVGDLRSYTLYDLEPACGERLELSMTAFSGEPLTPDEESPRSNTIVLEGPRCPRTVRVTFLDIQTYDLPGDPPEPYADGCPETQVGPIDLYGLVIGSDGVVLRTTYGMSCNRSYKCRWIDGYCLHPNRSHDIVDMVERCRFFRDEISSDWEEYRPVCSDDNIVEATLGPYDDLFVDALVVDQDTNNDQGTLLHGAIYTSSESLFPGSEYERTISDLEGRAFAVVTVRIAVLPAGP